MLTRGRRTSSLRPEDTTSSWTNGRKDCVSRPRGCHRGVFSSSLELPRNQLHSYRRSIPRECFAAARSFSEFKYSYFGGASPSYGPLSNFPSVHLNFFLIITYC